MTLTNNKKLPSFTLDGLMQPMGRLDGNANKAAAVKMIIDGARDTGGLEYSDAAEDNGTAGILDLMPGLIYTGPPGAYVNLTVQNLDAKASLDSATTPEATDSVAMGLYINSDLVAAADEGFVAEMDTVTAEFNIDACIGPLQTNDVVRVGILWSGEADADLTLPTPGTLVIT